MKIAIASTNKNKNSNISDKAGRAPYYLIFDGSLNLIEIINNPFSFGSGGSGFSVAKMLADKKIDMVIAGKFGQKMIEAMKERGLKYQEMDGTVEESLTRVKST